MVGDDLAWAVRILHQQVWGKARGGCRFAVLLQQNIELGAMLVTGREQHVRFLADVDEYLIAMPSRTVQRTRLLQLMGKVLAKFVAPPVDRLITGRRARLEEQLFNIPQSRLKTEIPPRRATDDGKGEPVAVVQGLECHHRLTLPLSIVNVTMP